MPKYYEVNQDDFENLPFETDLDESWSEHRIIIEERFKEEFIVEQIANFTRHLLSILHEKETRGDHYSFDKIAKKYSRGTSLWNEETVICPNCGEMVSEEEWNDEFDYLEPLCPRCEFEFEMEEE